MSNKKPFEYIEDKIRQAAESGQVSYGPPEWEKMEALLDKKEKRRRPFLWWFILPLIIAGSWGIYRLSTSSSSLLPSAQKSTTANTPGKSAAAYQKGESDPLNTIQPGESVPGLVEKSNNDGTA